MNRKFITHSIISAFNYILVLLLPWIAHEHDWILAIAILACFINFGINMGIAVFSYASRPEKVELDEPFCERVKLEDVWNECYEIALKSGEAEK